MDYVALALLLMGGCLFGAGVWFGWYLRGPTTIEMAKPTKKPRRWNPRDDIPETDPITPKDQRFERERRKEER